MNIDQLRDLLDKRQSAESRQLHEELKAAMKKASKTKKAELEIKVQKYDVSFPIIVIWLVYAT